VGKPWGPDMKQPQTTAVTWGFGVPPGTRTPNPLISRRGYASDVVCCQGRALTCAFADGDLSAGSASSHRFSVISVRKCVRNRHRRRSADVMLRVGTAICRCPA